MNKIFKVVWSKTKECYVVVSEVAKNNGGKKKVLASVLAGLAMVGATAQMGTPVQANSSTNGNNINVWSDQRVDTPVSGGPGVTTPNTRNTAGDNSVTIGQQLTTGTGAVAVGRLSTASGDRAVAIGEKVNAKVEDTISVGASNNSNTGGGITIGKGNIADSTANGGRAAGNSQIAIGRDNKASQEDTLALGRANTASGSVSVAIGSRSEATNSGSIAIAGNGDGYKTTSTGQGSIAIGMQSNSTGKASTAVGGVSQATATGAAALGYSANATAESATALGQESVASVKDGVALGSHSKATTAAGVDGYNPADSRTNTYAGLSGNAKTSTLAAVSVGDGSNATRQITGLAAGKEDTDAVNVAQLKNVNLKYAGNSGSGDVLLNNGTLNLKGEGLISTTADASGITVKIAKGDDITNNNGKAVAPSPNGVATTDNVVQAINKAGWNANASANGGVLTGSATATKVVPGDTVTFSAGKNLTVAQTLGTNAQQYTYSLNKDVDLTNAGSLTVGGTTVTNGGVTITAPTGGTTTNVTLTNAGLNNGGNKITNVAEGKADTDAVNVKQLKDAKTILKDGKNTTVVGTGTAADPYKVNVEGALTGITSISNATTGPKMTFGGSSINITGGNLSLGDGTTNNKIVNVAPGTDDNDAVNVKQLKNTELHITPGTYAPDSNKKVKLTYTDGNNTVVNGKEAVIDLSSLATGGTTSTEKVQKAADATNDKNIAEVGPKSGDTFGAANATYEVSVSRNAVKDAAREAVTINNGGTTTGGTYTADTNNPISVTPTPDNTNHNTTYAITFDGNKAAKQIPLTYKANGTGDKTVKLDKGLDFTNGTNTTAEIGNDGVVKFNLNKDVDLSNTGSLTVGDTKVTNGGVTITAPAGGTTSNVTLTQSGLDNGGNKIVNVANGDVNATSKDAVNGSQLHAVAAKERHIAPTTASHTAYTVDNNGDVTLDYVDGDGNATTEKAVIKGIANRDLSNISNAGETKIKNLAKSAIDMEDGKNTKASNREVNGVKTFKVDVEGALTDITSITNGGTNNGKISFGPNKTVTVDGDHSITLNASTGNIGGLQNKTFDPTNFTSGQAATEDQLKSVHDTLKASELHIAPTAVKASSTEAKGGTLNATGTANVYKYDATNKTVTLTYNDGNGNAVTDTKAVIDFSALNTGGTATSTWTAKTSAESTTAGAEVGKHVGDTSQVINDQKSVDFQAGRNMTVKQTNDGAGNTTINYALDKDLTNLDKVVVNGENGTNGKDGVTIIGPQGATGATGIPGTNGIDGKVGIAGKDGKDAVSISGKDGVGHIGLQGPKGAPGTPGADGANLDITTDHGTQTLVKPEANNDNKSERIVYVPKDANGNPLKDTDGNTIKREVATMDDGLKFTGNNTVIENKQKLGSLVKVQGEGTKEGTTVINPTTGEKELVLSDGATKFESAKDNIAVVADGSDTLTVKLNKNLNGINTIKNGNTTITLNDTPSTTTPAVTISGGDLSMGDGTHNNKIVNVAPGTDDSDAVNYKQLKAAKTEVKAGKNVVVTSDTSAADGHTTYTVNASTSAVYTKPDGTKLVKQPDGTFKDENGNAYTGPVIASFEDNNGSTTGGNMIVNNVGSAIKNQTGGDFLAKLDAAANTTTGTPNAAVNVSDLKNTADALTDKGLKFDANVGGVKTNKLGSTVKVQGAGASADADYSGANIKTFINQTGDDTTIDVKLDKNLAGINSITGDTNSGKLVFQDPTATGNNGDAFKFTGGNINAGNNNITNLKSGIVNNNATDDTNGANIGDVKKIAKDSDLHIAPTAGTANNVAEYTVDANNKVTLTYQDGNGTAVAAPKAVIDLSALANKITSGYTFNANATANGGTVANDATTPAAVTAVANGGTINYAAGKNLTVKQDIDATNKTHTYTYSLDKDLTNLDKVVVNGKDGIAGKDGVTIVGPQGATGATGIPGTSGIDGKVGIAGKDGKDAVSISGKDGVGHIGLQGPKGAPGTPGADGANLDITTDHGTQTLVKPEANNNNQSERIVYVPKDANGNPLKDTDGNTIKREVATMDDGLKFTGNNTGTVNKHKLGSLVKVQGEGVSATDEAAFVSASGNIAVTAENNDTLTIRLNKNLKGLNSIQLGDNTIKSNGDNIEFTTKGGTTKTVATTDQLWTIQANGTDVPATNGKVNVVGKDGITVAKNAAGNLEISGAGLGRMNGFDVTANNGATSKTITDGKKVDFNAGSNLTVKQTSDANGTHIEYALNKDVDLGNTGSLKIGDTTINNGGLTIANGPSVTSTGVDAGSKKITNVADGAVNATSKDAVNGSQLKQYTDAAKTTVEAGDTNVKVETDNSAADGHTNYKVSLEPVVEIGDTHKVKIDGHTGDITGLTNVTLNDPTFATKGRAATEEQLKQVLTEAKNKAIEKVQAGTAAAGDTNIATVAPKAGDTFGAAGATYEVSVSKNAVKDAAKEAVKVTSASPAITVTPDTSVAHETTYKVGFDGNQAATQIPLTYKQNGGNTRTVKLSDGLNFIDGTNTKARTDADGKVTFDVMGDLTGITSISNASGGPKMTFGGSSINVSNGDLNMGGNKITNVKKGTAPTDAANVGQLTKVISSNRSISIKPVYTDADGAPVYDLAVSGTPGAPAADPRVDMLGEEIGRVGAQGAALSALKPIQYDPLEPTQIMAGYGNYRGNSAIAMGVAHYKNESTLIHGGISWAGGSSHMMANAGVTWKVGNRDSEAAVADRYRKGPISSAYAMQQEMAAMKAQNAGLKGEVSDLKAENEQMKAQIAAMMAKLGL